jgi:hypothetical protein
MNNTFSISAVLSVLTGFMLLGVWGNIQVYAQPLSSVSAADSSSATSPQVKAIMCDPSNPSLKVVNTTEAHICGIPKTLKPSLSSSTPPTPAVSSTTTTTQQTTKPSVNPIVSTPSKQQEITTTGRNVADNTRIAPISNPATKQLSSTTTTTIAPQAIHQQQQQQQEQQPQPQILPLTATSNNTITLNNTLSTASPLLGPGKLTFLGFHGSGSTHSSSSSVKHSSDTKSSSSSKNEHSSDTKSTHSHKTSSSSSSHAKSSSHSDHGSKSSSSAGSSIGDKVRSIIRHALD